MHITATYGQDRPDLEGIYRLMELDLEPHDQKIYDGAWNALCALEYNAVDGDDDWKEEARGDIAAHTGVDEENIVIN